MKDYDRVAFGTVDAGEVKNSAGRYLIFTAPVLLLFADGKEVLREARIVHLDLLREKLTRITEAFLS